MTIDVEAELARYRGLSTKIRPFVTETGTSNSKQWIFPQLTTERFSSTYSISFAVSLMHSFLSEGKSVLVEGANASMLDIDFGTYP